MFLRMTWCLLFIDGVCCRDCQRRVEGFGVMRIFGRIFLYRICRIFLGLMPARLTAKGANYAKVSKVAVVVDGVR